ncbi:WD40 repeat domain-containing protein [Allokutzneria sp. NRRL B-24872]|uniref:WD40 repeat domain-containing protein n=1 Tax=Allokutzneria sp. NRRL B-24872 TaxID=1137961 RepID=UPI000A3ACB2B|nr:WD40 repeat domain-containing protein [Allokutzneria sp. NRRL B-24872]
MEPSPYLGLLPFAEQDAERFHGRERLIDSLAAAVGRAEPVVVVGPPGSGKTSLLRAGLLARLGGEFCRVITPGAEPLRELDAAASVLVVDQAEELFTQCASATERTAFLRALAELGKPVILALRADFYGSAVALPEFAVLLRRNQILAEPMTRDELRAVVEGPAAGLVLEEGLADRIVADFEHGTSLAPLSHALWATWSRRTENRLTVAGYAESAGIAEWAEQVHADLAPVEQEAARRVLVRLVNLGESTGITVELAVLTQGLPDVEVAERTIARLAEARLLVVRDGAARISTGLLEGAWPRLAEWLEAERDWRRGSARIAADAEDWDRAGRTKALLYKKEQLSEASRLAVSAPSRATDLNAGTTEFLDRSWRHHQRTRKGRRALLAVLVVLAILVPAVVFGGQASRAEDLALARSLAYEAHLLREREPGLAKQLSLLSYGIDREAGRRAVLDSQGTPGFLGDDKAATALAQDAGGAVLAIATADGVTLRGRNGSGRIDRLSTGAIEVGQDGSLLVAVDFGDAQHGHLRFWDITDPAHPRKRADVRLPAVVSSLATHGDVLYAGTTTGTVLVWDIAGRGEPKPLPSFVAGTKLIDSLAAAPRGGLLAVSATDGKVQLLDAADPGRLAQVAAFDGAPGEQYGYSVRKPVQRLAFDRTGRLLATTSAQRTGGNPKVWRLEDPRAPKRMPYADESWGSSVPSPCYDTITSLAFSSRGDHLVVGCGKQWQVLTLRDGSGATVLAAGASSPRSTNDTGRVVFDHTGLKLLQANATGVHVWDVGNPGQPGAKGIVPRPPGTAGEIAYRAAGERHLIAMRNVGTSSLWEVGNAKEPRLLGAVPSPNMFNSSTIALSRDGDLLAVPELHGDGKFVGVALRSTGSLNRPPLAMIDDLTNGMAELAFSPTAPLLAVSDVSGLASSNRAPASLRIFDISDPVHPRQVSALPVEAWNLAFSPDGRSLTAVLHGETAGFPYDRNVAKQLRAFDVTDPARPTELWRRMLPQGVNTEFAYSPDGALFVALDNSQTLRVWRLVDRRPEDTPVLAKVGNSTSAGRLAFSPDGKRLALIGQYTESSDSFSRAEIWDVTNPKTPVRQLYLPRTTSGFGDLEFGPDGTTLAVTHSGVGVVLWDTDLERLVAGLCAAVGDPISREQWERYLPGRDYRPPCS